MQQPRPPQHDEEDERSQIGHHPHRPVLDEDVRDVVAWAVFLHVLRLQLVQALYLAIQVIRREHRQQVGDLENLRRIHIVVAAPDLKRREGAVRRAGVPQCLGGRDLHRLVPTLDDPELTAHEQRQDDRRDQHDHRHRCRAPERVDLVLALEVPGRHRQHHQGAGHQRGEHHVGVAPEEHGVPEQRPYVVELRLMLGVQDVANRVLHPGVRRHDERR